MSLKEQHVPEILKGAIMVPVPKSSCPKTHRDFRPVALTSILMKTFEKMVRTELLRKTECMLDPLQFAYRPDRGVEDARVTLLIQYSVTDFNTIQPHILTNWLLEHFDKQNLAGGFFTF